MKIELKLLRAKKETPEGYPLVFEASHQGKRKQKRIAYCKEKHFLTNEKMISVKHPDYDLLLPKILNYKFKAKEIILDGTEDVELAMDLLFSKEKTGMKFDDAVGPILQDIRNSIKASEAAGDVLQANKLKGGLTIYENCLRVFNLYCPGILIKDLNNDKVMAFRKYMFDAGNSKTTVSLQLRTLHSLYKKILDRYKLQDIKPFAGAYRKLTTKSYATKKKNLSKESFRILEQVQLPKDNQKYLDMFLLQFYFAGADLMDIYFMGKDQLRGGRVYFKRGKLEDGLLIDLKVHPKAMAIIDKYKCEGSWLFPWSKLKADYIYFRNRVAVVLTRLQDDQAKLAEKNNDESLKLEVKPLGGRIAPKVARHSFATIAKRMGVEEDLLRELMGHMRDDVDNHYKDLYPEEVRDQALFKIIE